MGGNLEYTLVRLYLDSRITDTSILLSHIIFIIVSFFIHQKSVMTKRSLPTALQTSALMKKAGALSDVGPAFVGRPRLSSQAQQVQILALPKLNSVTGWRTGTESNREPRQAVTYQGWAWPGGQRWQTWLSFLIPLLEADSRCVDGAWKFVVCTPTPHLQVCPILMG